MAAGKEVASGVPTLELKETGDKMPVLGFGFWKIDKKDAADTVEKAVRHGWRHFDFASDYGNEAEAGEGLKRVMESGLVKREELFITSKLWCTHHKGEHVREAMEKTLSDLGLDYVDLYLIHFPISLEYVPISERYPAGWNSRDGGDLKEVEVPIAETWAAMESLVEAGLARNIGVSNFNCQGLREVLATSKSRRPQVVQVELHPHLTQTKFVRFAKSKGLVVQGFSPLGAGSYVPLGMATSADSVLESPIVKGLAEKYKKSPGQIVLRWGIQRETALVPKTTKEERMIENISIFDFELEKEDVQAIDALNRNHRYNDPGIFCEAAFGTFCPIYE